ncbi:unnamed protein product [Rotaria socialis]|uniref:Uncharacterized protein n=2 Tax=Rotaria socialis TaxID=392032 RepID=A0A817XCG1_9BILA|nr:unnamed protein product [Rotaria socialis]CAF4850700.1 unnamed protein product [Rotaria socialis]
MLSVNEHKKIKWQLDNIPESIKGKPRQNLRTTLKKKLHEHELISRFAPFEPYLYQQFFINRNTNAQTLHNIIEAVKNATSFTLDTESVCVYKKPNKPALIQLQIIQENLFSYIILIEVCHLPHPDEHTFKLIQRLFEYLFESSKNIYIWGSINELEKFSKFNLFSLDQIYLSNNINLQNRFKNYWHEHHPHQSTLLSTNNDISCICEQCLDIQLNNPWSLQDAVAYQLHKWLDKRYTCSTFDIGLDSTLFHRNSNELEHRNVMINYAVNDCLSMHQLLIDMQIIDNEQQAIELFQQPELITSIDHDSSFQIVAATSSTNIPSLQQYTRAPYDNILFDDDQEQRTSPQQRTILLNERQRELSNELQRELSNELQRKLSNERQWELSNTTTTLEQISDDDNELEQISDDENIPQTPQINLSHTIHSSNNPTNLAPLTIDEKRKIHNRSCTLKQRKKLYRHEFIRRGIDNRFSISQIKQILRAHKINFLAINKATSSTTNRTSLYIGIENRTLLSQAEHATRHLFTTAHYNEFRYQQRELHSNNYRHHHRSHK